MKPRLALEPLEDRLLLSGNVVPTVVVRLDPSPGPGQYGSASGDHDHDLLSALLQQDPDIRRDAVAVFSNLGTGGVGGFPAGSAAAGQTSLFSTVLSEYRQPIELTVPADGTVELTAPGLFQGGVILDVLRGGVPLPQPELEAVTSKYLTIIANFTDYRDDMSERRPDIERDAAGVLAASILSTLGPAGAEPSGFEHREPSLPGSTFVEAPVAPADGFAPGPAAPGQTSPFSAAALSELPLSSDLADSAEGAAELALPGPFADGLVLDAWQGGLPLRQTELVPVASRDLTIIAAYLVEPTPAPTTADRPEVSDTEVGLTDFIVGRQDARSVLCKPSRGAESPAPPRVPTQPQRGMDRVPVVPPQTAASAGSGAACRPAAHGGTRCRGGRTRRSPRRRRI